jgi:DNA-binding IscR family transcriptional regulator
VTVARIVDLFAEPRAPRRCLLGGGPCDPARPCTAHARWTALATAVRAPLDDTMLADLLDGAGVASPFSLAAPTAASVAGAAAGHP